MENLEIQSQSVSIPALNLPQIGAKQGSEGSLEGNSLEKFLPISLKGAAENLETMKSKSGIDYKEVLELTKKPIQVECPEGSFE